MLDLHSYSHDDKFTFLCFAKTKAKTHTAGSNQFESGSSVKVNS